MLFKIALLFTIYLYNTYSKRLFK